MYLKDNVALSLIAHLNPPEVTPSPVPNITHTLNTCVKNCIQAIPLNNIINILSEDFSPRVKLVSVCRETISVVISIQHAMPVEFELIVETLRVVPRVERWRGVGFIERDKISTTRVLVKEGSAVVAPFYNDVR